MRDLAELAWSLAKMLLMLAPFLLMVFLNTKSNLKREIRYRQFFMPIFALIYCVVGMVLLQKVYGWAWDIFQNIARWMESIGQWLNDKLPDQLDFIAQLFNKLSDWLEKLLAKLNLAFWAFYLANALLMLAYLLIKKIAVMIMKRAFSGENAVFQFLGKLFYDYDEELNAWYIKKNCGQARTFLKTFYIVSAVFGMVAVLVSSKLYLKGLLTAPFYPVFCVIIVGEVYFFLNGLMRSELVHELTGEEEEAQSHADYSIMRKVLRRLFPDRLSAEDTTVCDPVVATSGAETLLEQMEESGDPAQEAYALFMRKKQEKGLELDRDYLLSGRQLLTGESVLFNNPFYRDLIPYIFYPMNRTLLRHKKVLIILGRHGAEKDIEKWCQDGLMSVTNVPELWNVGVLSENSGELDVGIVTRSGVHDLKMHEKNRDFFDAAEFVVILEPSRLVATAQIGLNSLVRHCRRKEKKLVFCSADKNCDGLVDSLSHILMTSLREVSATGHHKGTSSYMIWEADDERLQHRMLPNLSRYLGMGTELSFAALKNQVEKTQWCGGEAFPVEDIHWIVKQYYYDLLNYAGLPPQQEVIDEKFLVSTDMWSTETADRQYLTVEDESFNMFEVKRDFSTRALDQGFINVISSEYLLKDYMTANDGIFNADPKAIPYITADYARSPRNVALRLCLRMSTSLVPESDVLRDLMLIDREVTDPIRTLWSLICSECGHIGRVKVDMSGRTLLCCDTADGPVTFNSDVIVRKRRFCMDTGIMESMYCITNARFTELVLGDLRSVEYIAEDEKGEQQYLGIELRGQVFQKHLPSQLFTFSGKYYEMLRVTSDGRVLLRRAADHIDGRPFYRQERKYYMSNAVDSQSMGQCRDMGNIRIIRQFADFRVSTPAYWQMNRYNDFSTGRRMGINGVPDRRYNNKSMLRIDVNPNGHVDQNTLQTLALLINEVLRTLLAENQDFVAVLTPGEIKAPLTYSLEAEQGFELQGGSIYILEDSQLDMGLLDAVERNLYRIFAIVSDYLQWHDEALKESKGPDPEDQPAGAPAGEGAEGTDGEESEDEEDGKGGKRRKRGKKKRKKGGFWGKIGGFFKKIGEFFKNLFRRKKKKPTDDAEQPEPEDEKIPDPDEPLDGWDDSPIEDPIEDPVEDSLDEPIDEPNEEPVEDSLDEPIDELDEEPVEDSLDEPIDELDEEGVEDSLDEPIDELDEEPVEDSLDEPIDGLDEEGVEDSLDEPIDGLDEEGVEDSLDEPIDETNEEPVEEAYSGVPMDAPLDDEEPFIQANMMFSAGRSFHASELDMDGGAGVDTDTDIPDGPTETTTSGEGNDVLEFEPEQVVKATDVEAYTRKPYHERYYLMYGDPKVSEWLDTKGVLSLLESLGYGNNFLTQARKGRDVASMIERTFVPNQEGVQYCDFCGRELTGAEYEILADGRERCTECGRTAVKSMDEFVALHDAVLRNMKLFFGIKINAKVHVQMVNSKKLHKKLGKTFIPTGKFDGRVLGVAIKDRSGYSILIENGAPKIESTKTMVHEMTHIWQYLNWDGKEIRKTYGADQELEIYEGMAKWVEIQYAYLLGETAAAKREEIISRHRDDEYGRGFLKYVEKYPLSIDQLNGAATPFDHPKNPL